MQDSTNQTFKVLFGEDVDISFLDKLDYVDHACYEEKYWGEQDNTVDRYIKNEKSFVFVLDTETDNLAGYINFFPCEEGLYADNLGRCPIIRDDDITPDEVANYNNEENHLFIISIAVHPHYQGTDVIKMLNNAFIEYLHKLQNEYHYPITDIIGTAVSPHGKKALRNLLFREHHELQDGNTVFICDGPRVEKLVNNDLYFRSFKSDLWLLVPLAEHEANLRVSNLLDQNNVSAQEDADDSVAEQVITDQIIANLKQCISYECSNEVVRDLDMVSLGSYDFLHTLDDYAGQECEEDEVVVGDVRGQAVLIAHRKTHMFVLAILLSDYPYSVTQMEDQVSYGYLKIRNPQRGDGSSKYVYFTDYLLQTYGLHMCGQTRCVVYMSNKPKDSQELQDILAAESYVNYEREYGIDSDEIDAMACENKAQFDDYEVYLSSRAIAYIDKNYSRDLEDRIESFADYLFIVILVLLQNTALCKVNLRVTKILESDSDISPKVKLAIDKEYGRTIRFWENQNFKYLSSQIESEHVRNAFLNQDLHDIYNEHQEYLEHLVSVKSAITEGRNGMIINVVAIMLAVMQLQPFFIEVMQGFYELLGIEAEYAASTTNFGVYGGLIFFIVVVFINQRRRRYLQKQNL